MDPEKQKEIDFLTNLRGEIRSLQEIRERMATQKLLILSGLFGLGSFGKFLDCNDNLGFLFFILPFIAYSYDFYILGDDFGIKRASCFLKKTNSSASQIEKNWQTFAIENADILSLVARFIVTILVFAGSIFFVFSKKQNSAITCESLALWLIINLLTIIILFILTFWIRNRFKEK